MMAKRGCFLMAWFLLVTVVAQGAGIDEFKVKREEVFAFAEKPTLKCEGDQVTISFATKGLCDVTVAIEDDDGKIVRHLASGVLGQNAPPPFKRNSTRQTLVWDGKDDQGRYVDDKDDVRVRVSLGLKPRLEKTLFWDPRKRVTSWGSCSVPLIKATPEGVYVYEGACFDHVRLFDHDGNYVRTVYPFPAGNTGKVKGLRTHTFPHSNKTLPLKTGFYQCTLLHGPEVPLRTKRKTTGFGATALDIRNGRVALVGRYLSRLAPDGTSGGLPIYGPKVFSTIGFYHCNAGHVKNHPVPPSSAAFSPDGKTLYLAGYMWRRPWCFDTLHGVMRVDFEKGTAPELFKGDMKYDNKDGAAGKDNDHFNCPSSVACDAKGRVYVSDFMNDRIQVFSPDGKHLKSIPVKKPAKVVVHRKTGEIFVFSWGLMTRAVSLAKPRIKARMDRLGTFDNPKTTASYALPLPEFKGTFSPWYHLAPRDYEAEVDVWADKLKVWLFPGFVIKGAKDWSKMGILLLEEKGGKLKVKRDLGKEVAKSVKRAAPPVLDRQRLYVDPAKGMLYVGEADAGVCKSFKQLVRIDPKNGKVKTVNLPFDCEDLCFDINGLAYLRTGKEIVRYDPRSWREVPWDYGEERAGVGFDSGRKGRSASAVSALPTPGHRSHSFWHMGGIAVSAKGHLAVSTCNGANPGVRKSGAKGKADFNYQGQPYVPKVYPGRYRWGEIHIYDRHGKPIRKDAFPGIGHMNGLGIDARDGLYVMASGRRLFNGKPYDAGLPDDLSDTLIKAEAGKVQVVSASRRIPVPVDGAARPNRKPDISGGQAAGGDAWVKGASWFYGGVGFAGKNASWDGGGCCCWNARFGMDYFARSFAPELRHFSVAVLDTAGNLILRVGRYGNVDDGKPLEEKGGPKNTRSIGGDEVSLFHGAYIATHTDKRLFIADPGNARIVSVKLGYHEEVRMKLGDVK